MSDQHDITPARNAEGLSFPLKLLIQVVSLAIVCTVFAVRIEGKLNSLETRVEQISTGVEKRSDKADAIHSAMGADISNHNTRITVLESQVSELRSTPHKR